MGHHRDTFIGSRGTAIRIRRGNHDDSRRHSGRHRGACAGRSVRAARVFHACGMVFFSRLRPSRKTESYFQIDARRHHEAGHKASRWPPASITSFFVAVDHRGARSRTQFQFRLSWPMAVYSLVTEA
jgi:hypothetical protein